MPLKALLQCSLAWLLTAAVTCGPGGGGGTPSPDSCASPDQGAVTAIEIGSSTESSFEPLVADDQILLVNGLQGADMIGLRLRLSGDAVPQCLAQTTTLRDADQTTLATSTPPLQTYEAEPGVRTTMTLWVPIFGPGAQLGSQISIEANAGGSSTRVSVLLVDESSLSISVSDAGPNDGN